MNLTDNEGNIICEISKVKLQPEDIIVLDYKDAEPLQDAIYETSKYMNQMFPNNRILFLCKGVELKIIEEVGNNEQGD